MSYPIYKFVVTGVGYWVLGIGYLVLRRIKRKLKKTGMRSDAKNVADYLKEVPEKRKDVLKKIRKLCKEIMKDHEELMAYGMPCYKKNDGIEIGFASQKNHISFYFAVRDAILDNKKLFEGLNHGKGCIRYSNPDKIDLELIRKLLEATVKPKKNLLKNSL